MIAHAHAPKKRTELIIDSGQIAISPRLKWFAVHFRANTAERVLSIALFLPDDGARGSSPEAARRE